MKFEVVKAKPEHIPPIAANLRQADINELWAVACVTGRDALERSLEASEVAGTWLVNDVPACMAGVTRNGDDGVIWLLATDAVDKYPRQFLQASRRGFESVQDKFDRLYNYIDVRNTKSLRWLKWLGFEIHAPKPHGMLGKPFHYFEWQRKEVKAA
jgi:hypothetical protein